MSSTKRTYDTPLYLVVEREPAAQPLHGPRQARAPGREWRREWRRDRAARRLAPVPVPGSLHLAVVTVTATTEAEFKPPRHLGS